jgi:DNA-binding MarR family transcriptional regulator
VDAEDQDQQAGESGQLMIKTGSERPIGFWLKKLDRLIDQQFDQQLGEAGLSRRQWQVLNLLKTGPRSEPELQSELEPFLQQAPDDLAVALSGLVTRGWADSQDNLVTLTDSGQAQFELIKAKVAELPQKLAVGISPEEYRTTIDVLGRMAANLEPDVD